NKTKGSVGRLGLLFLCFVARHDGTPPVALRLPGLPIVPRPAPPAGKSRYTTSSLSFKAI
ncbi:hypothetical protein, partial [Klebsiella aerogenes]|uniref:hypothetical protein n=1 Tax=Klebsiella aerogenes TaxID=548 RepID=UPI001A9176B3